MQKHPINKDWFIRALEANHKSVRGLAKHLNIDPSAASRMLSGTRKMKAEEAASIASFIGTPVNEVLKQAGVEAGPAPALSKIMLSATINDSGEVERLAEERQLPQSVIERAQAAINGFETGNVMAAQIRASKGPLSVFDDALVLFKATKIVENSAIGSVSVCRTTAGTQIMAKIERARKTGEARVIDISGKEIEVDLRTAAPVLAIIP